MPRILSALKRLFISLLLGANLATLLLLWTCAVLTYVSPETLPLVSLMTLAFPIFCLADALFVPLWLFVHRRLAWLPIAGALLVAPFILDYCPLNRLNPLRHSAEASAPDSAALAPITLLSYNIGGIREEEDREAFVRYLREQDADIVCLQEFSASYLNRASLLHLIDSAGYHSLATGSKMLLSRFPILGDTLTITYPTRSNGSVGYWLAVGGDSVLVVNNHLESNHLTDEEKSDYRGLIRDPHREKMKREGRHLLAKLTDAAVYRGAQTDTLCALIDRYAGHPMIVCGDMNDSPVSYTCQQLQRRLASCFRQGGTGPGISYTQRAFSFRIDHAFVSPHWQCTECRIDRTLSVSDHYPLVARLQPKMQ